MSIVLDTNIVKLRDNKWEAMKVTVSQNYSAGDFIWPNLESSVVGVLTEDTLSGETGLIVYKAAKIIVPCNFDIAMKSGEYVFFEIGANRVSSVGTLFCGKLTENVALGATECEIELIGFISNNDIIPIEECIEIETLDQLLLIGNDPDYPLNGKYCLQNDINCIETDTGLENPTIYIPIGSENDPFKGVFNGNGYKIYNLFVIDSTGYNIGIFGVIQDAVIKNLGIEFSYFEGNINVGCLAGGIITSTIYNCYSLSNELECNSTGGGCLVGGSVSSLIKFCFSNSIIYGAWQLGGLVGINNQSYIENSFAISTVVGGGACGGLAGFNSGHITKCHSAGDINGSSDLGGLVGINLGGTVIDSYYNTETSGQSDTGKGIPTTTENMLKESTFSGWNFNTVWEIVEGRSYPSLIDLSRGMFIFISDIEELQKIGNEPKYYLDCTYLLINDIDASDTATWNDGAGFIPIGSEDDPFIGFFINYFGFKISDLTINRPLQDNVGLFSYIKDSFIFGLILDSINCEGKNNVGAVVGTGDLSYLIACKTINNNSLTGVDAVGGLIGSASNRSLCLYSISQGSIVGSSKVGGLIGLFNNSGCGDSFSSAEVTAGNNVGGLIGEGDDTSLMNNCYAYGNIIGVNNVGGLIGKNSASVSNSYSYGNISGITNTGGAIGSNTGLISFVYYDSVNSGQSDSGKGLSTTPANLKKQATFIGWNFDTIWEIEEDVSYPTLIYVKLS